MNIFIVRDEFNRKSAWEVVIGTERIHCKDGDEVIDIIKRAIKSSQELQVAHEETFTTDLHEKIFDVATVDPVPEGEEIFRRHGEGD